MGGRICVVRIGGIPRRVHFDPECFEGSAIRYFDRVQPTRTTPDTVSIAIFTTPRKPSTIRMHLASFLATRRGGFQITDDVVGKTCAVVAAIASFTTNCITDLLKSPILSENTGGQKEGGNAERSFKV
jgi:hypothetical protein